MKHLVLVAVPLIALGALGLAAWGPPEPTEAVCEPIGAPPVRAAASPHPATTFAHDLEFVALDSERMMRVRVAVAIGGKPIAVVWDDAFGRLLALYDRDGDGALNRTEAARLPSVFSLRQLLWGRSAPYTGRPAPWDELAGGKERVGTADLARYYRAAGLGGATLAYGRAAGAAARSDALFHHLDADGSGTIEPAEWKAAPDRLGTLDRNGDELVSAVELLPRTPYPGGSGVGVLLPPTGPDGPGGDECPLVVLPSNTADTGWAARLVRLRDRNGDGRLTRAESGLAADTFDRLDTDTDGALTPGELAKWRDLAPDTQWRLEAGTWPDGEPLLTGTDGKQTPRLETEAGTTRLSLLGDRGQIAGAMATARKRLLEQFADADRGQGVRAADVTKRSQYELQQLLELADRDSDGRLTAAEVKAWLDAQDAVAAAHVLITVHDHGRGLFELLDTSRDGALSLPELRTAANRAALAKTTTLPRHLLAVVSRGHPREPVGGAVRRGPDWFVAMDRNGDGVVSRAEFAGPAEQFDKLDLDRNGQLDPDEAERVGAEKK